jgi:hypothetical protein
MYTLLYTYVYVYRYMCEQGQRELDKGELLTKEREEGLKWFLDNADSGAGDRKEEIRVTGERMRECP